MKICTLVLGRFQKESLGTMILCIDDLNFFNRHSVKVTTANFPSDDIPKILIMAVFMRLVCRLIL